MSLETIVGQSTLDSMVKCDKCRRTAQKKDTLVLFNRKKKNQWRLCRDCQFDVYMEELKEQNPSIDIRLKVQDFSKGLKDGRDQRS